MDMATQLVGVGSVTAAWKATMAVNVWQGGARKVLLGKTFILGDTQEFHRRHQHVMNENQEKVQPNVSAWGSISQCCASDAMMNVNTRRNAQVIVAYELVEEPTFFLGGPQFRGARSTASSVLTRCDPWWYPTARVHGLVLPQ